MLLLFSVTKLDANSPTQDLEDTICMKIKWLLKSIILEKKLMISVWLKSDAFLQLPKLCSSIYLD